MSDDTLTAASPAGAPAGLFDLYTRLRSSGLSDEDAALQLAQQKRTSADNQAGWRRVADIMNGTNTSDALHAQLMQQADKPLSDLAERRKAAPFAAEETGRQAGAIGQDIAMRQQVGMLDPAHPANRALQSILGSAAPGIPPEALSKLTVAQYPGIKEALSQYLDLVKPTIQPAPVAALTGAQAAKTAAETKAIIPAEVAQRAAQTAKTSAETRQIDMETSGQVSPGWVVAGTQGVKQEDRNLIKGQAAAVDKSSKLIDQISAILNDDDTVMPFSKKAAKIAPLMTQLTLASKEGAGIRGLPAQDVAFLQNASGDLSAGNVANWFGLNHNPVRLQQLKKILSSNLESDANARGIVRAPAAAQAAKPTHYLISPDKKFRIPADASGKPLGPQEPNG